MNHNRFARWVFTGAGVYGLLVLTPYYFREQQVGELNPPAITHPEFYYGFIGIAVAWQLAFLIIGRNPARYRLLMLPAVVEKATYGIAALVLNYNGRLRGDFFVGGMVDLGLGILFAAAFIMTTSRDA